MAKFLAVHSVGKDLTLESAKPMGKAVKANSTVDAYWVRSWYAPAEGKMYCEWDAKDADSVRRIITKAAPKMPLDGVYKLDFVVDGEDFR